MRRALLVFGGGLTCAALVLAASAVGAGPARHGMATVTIDRTFACTAALQGGARKIEIRANRGSGRMRSGWDRPAFVGVTTNVTRAVPAQIDDHLVWAAAGRPGPGALIVRDHDLTGFPFRAWGSLAVSRRVCGAARASVPLTARGLQPAFVGPLPEHYDCLTPSRVLVRFRAVVDAGGLGRYRGFQRAGSVVRSATLALRTDGGKPLLRAEVAESGKATLQLSPTSCFPD